MSEKFGKNSGDYKRINRGLVLKMIATKQCFSRIELARSTGLSKMAITNIVSEMLQQHFLIETKITRSSGMGRTPIQLAISPKAPKVIGLVILRDRCEAILCDLSLNILKRECASMENMNEQRLIDQLFDMVNNILQDEQNVVAIGIASVGPISTQRGMILNPFYFYGIENVKIVQKIEEQFHLPTFLDHDNQSAALAETLFGNGRGFRDVLFVGIGEGVGCGVISDGQLYSNHRGLPPEIGHVSIDIKGKKCLCGNHGCVESYLRTPVLLHKLRYHTQRQDSYEAFCKIEDDSNVDLIFMTAVNELAAAIVSTVNILNSEIVILGHDSVFWADRYLATLEERIAEQIFVKRESSVQVKRAFFMQDAQLIGAACHAVNQIFDGDLVLKNE